MHALTAKYCLTLKILSHQFVPSDGKRVAISSIFMLLFMIIPRIPERGYFFIA